MPKSKKPSRITGTVQKWGNTLAIRLPKAIAESARLAQGSKIEFAAKVGEIKIRSVSASSRRRSPFTVAKMLAGFKGPSPYRYLDTDPPVGRELI